METIKKYIFNLGILFGVAVTKATHQERLKSLISKLKPVNTNHSLIRVGGKNDGGYLVPDDLDNIEALFSPGVGSVCEFEKFCHQKGMKIFLADKSVDALDDFEADFNFKKMFLGSLNNGDYITLEKWIDDAGLSAGSDLMLQMDIEGYEYQVIHSTSSSTLERFRIIVIEFHKLYLLFSESYFEQVYDVFEKLLQTHDVVHIHPNNCSFTAKKGKIEIPSFMEFTFLRKDRISFSKNAKVFPHPLDQDVIGNKKSVILPKCWYGDDQ